MMTRMQAVYTHRRAMGIFHYRCGVSGLSLNGEVCVAIWICETAPGTWVPAALPVRGRYDGYGRIDQLHHFDGQDWNVARLRKWFEVGYEIGRIQISGDSERELERKGLGELAGPIAIIERATTREFGKVTFDGQKLAQRLINAAIFDAVVAAQPRVAAAAVRDVLPCAAGAWFYQTITADERAAADDALAALAAFRGWFTDWTPEREPDQLALPELIRDHRAARAKYAGTAWLLDAIDGVIAEAEHDGYQVLPARWLRDWGHSWYGAVLGEYREVATSREELVRVIDDNLAWNDDVYAGGRVEAFAVVAGTPQPPIDLRPWLRIARNDDGDQATIDPAAVTALPELAAPLLPAHGKALFLWTDWEPAWADEDELREQVFAFATYGE
jgi:hypothetical protein